MPTAKQRRNWARFAKMARARARAAKRGSSRSTPRRAPVRRRRASPRSYMPRKTSRRGSRRGSRTVHVLAAVANLNTLFQGLEPFVRAGVIQAARAGDFEGVMAALTVGGKEALSIQNILQALGPQLALKAIKTLLSLTGTRSPSVKLGSRRVALI